MSQAPSLMLRRVWIPLHRAHRTVSRRCRSRAAPDVDRCLELSGSVSQKNATERSKKSRLALPRNHECPASGPIPAAQCPQGHGRCGVHPMRPAVRSSAARTIQPRCLGHVEEANLARLGLSTLTSTSCSPYRAWKCDGGWFPAYIVITMPKNRLSSGIAKQSVGHQRGRVSAEFIEGLASQAQVQLRQA